MSKLFSTFAFFLFCTFSFGQQVCELALEIEEPQNYCGNFSFNDAVVSEPSSSCNPTAAAENIWFSFVADGANLVINAAHQDNANVYFSVIQFTTIDCDPSKYVEIACDQNSMIAGGLLEEGVEYYVLFEVEGNPGGNVELCIHSQHDTPPPVNDKPCDAIALELDDYCIQGTTQYAELHQDSFPCSEDYIHDVWYKFNLTDDLAFGVEVFLSTDVDTAEFHLSLVEFTFDTCASEYVTRRAACDFNDGLALESNALDRNTDYYIIVSSKPGDHTEFELCINQFIADDNTLICFPELITVNGECQEVDLFNTIYTPDLPDCDNSNHLKYYQFDSGDELKSVEIVLDSLGEESSVFIGFGYFINNTCLNEFVWMDQYCGDISNARLLVNDLAPNREYTIAIGNNFGFIDKFSMCINGNYPNPFFNSDPCTAFELTPDQNCIGGTSAVGGLQSGTMPCDPSTLQTENWYKIKTSNFDSPSLYFDNFSTDENYQFSIGYFPQGCTNDFVAIIDSCAANNGIFQDLNLPDTIDFIYMSATYAADTTHNFKLCIDYEDTPVSCENNDFCHEAINIGPILPNEDNCFEACTYNATQENSNIPHISDLPSVWYSFTSTEKSTIELTFGESYDAKYYISLASSDNCNDFIIHDIKYAFIDASSYMRFNVPASGKFYLIVSSLEEEGGYLNICARKETVNTCTKNDALRVSNTSMGSSFAGPFQPNEIVTFCYDLPVFEAGSLADCQWLQGIIPSFGPGWNEESFDSTGMPVMMNIIEPVDADVTWNWFDDINSNVNNEKLLLYFNQQADLDICHLSETNCQGSPLAVDDLLPAGWFAYKTESSHPENSYGDGLTCDMPHGSWQVCFNLIAGGTDDHTISMYTFADGLIANDVLINDYCINDSPERQKYFVECQETPLDTSITIQTCDLLETSIFPESNKRYFWTTTVDPLIQNNTNGSDSEFTVQLSNLSDTIQVAQYYIQEFSKNGCLERNIDLKIELYPSISIPRPATQTVCLTDSISMNEIIQLSDYVYGAFTVDWGSDYVANHPSAFWKSSVDDTINYHLISAAGCEFLDTFIIDIEDVMVGESVMEQTICRDEILDFHEALPLTDLIEESFDVDWDLDGVVDTPFVEYAFTESTLIPFTITGGRGCQFTDTLSVYVPHIDLSSVIETKLCSTDEIQVSGSYTGADVMNSYWLTPKGDSIPADNFSLPADDFEMGVNSFGFYVTSVEGCPFSLLDTVELFQVPEVVFENPSDLRKICSYEKEEIKATVSPNVYDLNWQSPLGAFDGLQFETSIGGDYIYQAGYEDDDISCISYDTITVEILADVETSFTYDTLICVNDSTQIISSDPNYKFAWTTGSNSSVVKVPPGDYSVVVSTDEGCIKEFDFDINGRELPNPFFSYDTQICEGDSTEIVAQDEQFNYVWDSGNVEPSEWSFGGSHKVTVMDDIMCTDSFEFFVEVLEYPDVMLDYSIVEDTLFLSNLTSGDYDCSYVLDDVVIDVATDTFLVLIPGDYSLTLTCNNEICSDSEIVEFTIMVDGVKPQNSPSVQLFPNPNDGSFMVEYGDAFLTEMQVFSMDGKLVEQRMIRANHSYNAHFGLQAGTYFVKMFFDSEVVVRKIIVY